MLTIASNLTTRNRNVYRIFQQSKARNWNTEQPAAGMFRELARLCQAAGADVLEIDTQQHYDSPEAMQFAVRVIQQIGDVRLCLSTDNSAALKTGLEFCVNPPLVNYFAIDEIKLKEMLPIISSHKSEVILLVSDPAHPADAREMLQKAATLVSTVNEAGIPNNRILLDPGLIHITGDVGQRHLVEVMEFLYALPEVFEPAVKSTCWLGSASVGAPRRLRSTIETALLPMLTGAGLSSVFLDVLRRENMRNIRLIDIFNNETVYSDSELALK